MNRRLRFLTAGWWLWAGVAWAAADLTPFEFREPQRAVYFARKPPPHVDVEATLRAQPMHTPGSPVSFSRRVVLQLAPSATPAEILRGRPLVLARRVRDDLLVLEAPDAWTAMEEADRLARLPDVLVSRPLRQKHGVLDGQYARHPNDPYFQYQWPLEQRDASGVRTGVDLNARSAWPYATGAGVTIAVVDLGVELSHPDLQSRTAGAPHHNFVDGNDGGFPFGNTLEWAHGTEVAGLAVATANNGLGMTGVAPDASLASWVVFDRARELIADETRLMDMFQFASNTVSVQNHSWSTGLLTLDGPGALEDAGIENAIQHGRDGRGVIFVRSAGNHRPKAANANDDGYVSDPRVIAVASVRYDGRTASYSEPGACVLLAAPSSDTGLRGLFTTDLTEERGANQIHFFDPPDLWDYVFDSLGFTGTSASAPQVAGIAALLLSANPQLTYRDVQQILILSARHFDFTDADLTTNGAGFRVSHNQGFGVPDAGQAVARARAWPNRPPPAIVTASSTNAAAIPDDGLRVTVLGDKVPDPLLSVHCLPGTGPHADDPTAAVPLVDIGLATNAVAVDLTGKAALIERGGANYDAKVLFAAQAGAQFAVIYNSELGNTSCPGGEQLCPVGGVDFTPIPAVFVRRSDGLALRDWSALHPEARVQIRLNSLEYELAVTNTLICEHAGVRLRTDHPLRGDLRVTLVSPAGTRSVLQRYNSDLSPGPVDWTYYSTHHFFESSAGPWRVEVSDEGAGQTGSVLGVDLIVRGVAIADEDADGLADNWERRWFGSLAQGPRDDADRDGYSNMREQLMDTDPAHEETVLRADFSVLDATHGRLSWPASTSRNYRVRAGTDVSLLPDDLDTPVTFPETELVVPLLDAPAKFLIVEPGDSP